MPCHTCHKKNKESCLKCKHCKEAVYCDEECQSIGWSLHQCNVITVPEADMTVLAPVDSVDEQYIVRFVNPKGVIEQRIVKPTIAGAVVDSIPTNLGYSMAIEFPKHKIDSLIDDDLTLSDNAIWHGAQGVAERLVKDADQHLLWPGPARIQQAGLVVPAHEDGTVRVTVNLDNGEQLQIHALYPAFSDASSTSSRQLTPIQLDFQKKFRRGDPSMMAKLPNLQALMGVDTLGNPVQFTFHVKNNQAQLVDIEYGIGANAIAPRQSLLFRCDPANLDQVTGLVMALEDKMAAGELEGPTIQQAFDTIDTHRRMLEEDLELVVSPKVNAAVKEATDALWQTIDGMARERRYLDKLVRAQNPEMQAIAMAKSLASRMAKARATKSKLGKFIAKGRKRQIRLELEDLRNAIHNMSKHIPPAGKRTAEQQTQADLYEKADTIINNALSPDIVDVE